MSTTAESLHAYIEAARWFGGKGRRFTVSAVHRLGEVPPVDGDASAPVAVELVEVTFDDGEVDFYQMPLLLSAAPEPRLDHAFVGYWEDADHGPVHAYDAVHDRDAMARFLAAFLADEEHVVDPDGALTFVRLPGTVLDPLAPAALFGGEQSNSSVLFGEDSVLKLFRKIHPGENPDISTHRVLTEAGSTHVARLYGWIEALPELGGERLDVHLGMLQQFLRTASDGWELALVSVRDLFSEADLHADEVGGDFAAESERLGEALAEVHLLLRQSFPTGTVAGPDLSAGMRRRLTEAVDVVPDLAEYADPAAAIFAAVGEVATVPVQRIHGDLHLGQSLRTTAGWKLVDFEGEPVKPLAERLLPDSPWRDVAGLLRSFDYAPHAVAASLGGDDPDVRSQRAHRAEEWATRNRSAFLDSYLGGSDLSDTDNALLTAYVLDKAIYECVYETRNRPAWARIPLTAVARLTG